MDRVVSQLLAEIDAVQQQAADNTSGSGDVFIIGQCFVGVAPCCMSRTLGLCEFHRNGFVLVASCSTYSVLAMPLSWIKMART
jgi:hypothetical protein